MELLFLIVGVAYAGALLALSLVWQFKPLREEEPVVPEEFRD